MVSLCRHPDLWNRPDEFLPERFLPGSTVDADRPDHPFKYMPFLAGPRACVGQAFALLEATCILATMLLKVDLEVEPGHPDVTGITGNIINRPTPYLRMIVRLV
mmetsp:Transcript_18627/g.51433  ORF Transcript_18627/g.51433 Transcript_18627/m.51433 type:complete len:104 (+) Transcript_18627:162-473(+)